MNIASLLIDVEPRYAGSARALLEQVSGVSIYAVTAQGRLIVTVEAADDVELKQAIERLGTLHGVRTASLVYHHSEALDDESPATGETKP